MTLHIDKVFDLMEQLEKAKPSAIEQLLAQRTEIDKKLAQLGYAQKSSATGQKRAPKACSNCRQKGHTVRTCPNPKK